MSKPNFKTFTLKTLKERFRDKFGKDLITWDETKAGPEPDERLFNDIYNFFQENGEYKKTGMHSFSIQFE